MIISDFHRVLQHCAVDCCLVPHVGLSPRHAVGSCMSNHSDCRNYDNVSMKWCRSIDIETVRPRHFCLDQITTSSTHSNLHPVFTFIILPDHKEYGGCQGRAAQAPAAEVCNRGRNQRAVSTPEWPWTAWHARQLDRQGGAVLFRRAAA